MIVEQIERYEKWFNDKFAQPPTPDQILKLIELEQQELLYKKLESLEQTIVEFLNKQNRILDTLVSE